MDAYSSSSKYHADSWIYGYALLYFSDAFFFSLFVFFGFLCSPFPPFSSTNSEEAKSTTWLHPVTGEAVITGHRKTPGKQCENGGVRFNPCEKHRTHMRARSAWERLSARHGGGKEKEKRGGDKLRREPWKTMRGDFFSLQQSNSLLCPAPLFCSPLADHYARRPPPLALSLRRLSTLLLPASPGHFATHFLKVPSRRREPISEPIPCSDI